MRNTSTMPHELGHNLSDLDDLYRAQIDPAPDDLVTKENAWAAYGNDESVPPALIVAAMGSDAAPDRVVHANSVSYPHYSTLFDNLKVTSSALAPAIAAAPIGEQFTIGGWMDAGGQAVRVKTSLASGLETTPPVPGSPCALVFGSGQTALLEYPFAVREQINPPEGFDTWPLSAIPFHDVAPFPMGTTWVELRRNGVLGGRYERLPHPPPWRC